MKPKRGNFYARDPMKALNGMTGLSLEERGVYNVVIDLLYCSWKPIDDNRQFIAGWCGCAVQKLNPIIERLVAKLKLVRFEIDGEWFLSDDKFEAERLSVKGTKTDREGTAKSWRSQGEVGEKSDRSPVEVGQNPPLIEAANEENQGFTPLDKNRTEERRDTEAKASAELDFKLEPDKLVWAMACEVLAERANMGEQQSRAFFGRLLSAHRIEARDMLPAVSAAMVNGTQDPKAYLTKAAQSVSSRRAGPQKRVGFV